MFTSNQVIIRGPAEQILEPIYQLAANIQDWPTVLPHYRYMRVLESSDRYKVADFGASRDGFPCVWRARQDLFPEERRIEYRHIRGVTRGMFVEWRLESRGDRVEVTIDHSLSYRVPLLGPWFAEYVVGDLFVHNIAGKTLACIKAKVEATV